MVSFLPPLRFYCASGAQRPAGGTAIAVAAALIQHQGPSEQSVVYYTHPEGKHRHLPSLVKTKNTKRWEGVNASVGNMSKKDNVLEN